VSQYPEIAAFYIRYMEQHWIIEKEPYEISVRHPSASSLSSHSWRVCFGIAYGNSNPVLIERTG
jgi:hypothetical protein